MQVTYNMTMKMCKKLQDLDQKQQSVVAWVLKT